MSYNCTVCDYSENGSKFDTNNTGNTAVSHVLSDTRVHPPVTGNELSHPLAISVPAPLQLCLILFPLSHTLYLCVCVFTSRLLPSLCSRYLPKLNFSSIPSYSWAYFCPWTFDIRTCSYHRQIEILRPKLLNVNCKTLLAGRLRRRWIEVVSLLLLLPLPSPPLPFARSLAH